MTETYKKSPSKEGKILLESLQKAVADILEKKRRLGQYAVVWRDGKPVATGAYTQSDHDNLRR